jgi:molybdate transport system substrate-binding protein
MRSLARRRRSLGTVSKSARTRSSFTPSCSRSAQSTTAAKPGEPNETRPDIQLIRRTIMTFATFVRSMRLRCTALAALLMTSGAMAPPAQAEEIRLLAAAAMQTVFQTITDEFERTSGHKLVFVYTTMGAITERVLAGETADLIIGSTQSLERLAKEGRIDPASRVTIAKVGIGAVVPTGTPKQPIGSADELRAALLNAKTIVYAFPAGGGAAGVHIAKVIGELGIAEQVKAKTRFGAGGDVTEVTMAQGPGAFGMTQISEIVHKQGADFVGPFPPGLQNYTGVTIGTPAGAKPSEAVKAMIAFLHGPSAVAAIKARGMEVE